MHLRADLRVFESREEDLLIERIFDTLSCVGFVVENDEMLERLAQEGCKRLGGQRVLFPTSMVEGFIKTSPKASEMPPPRVSASAGVYEGKVLDPLTNEYSNWSEEYLGKYARLADSLENLEGASMLGCPLHSQSPLQPLMERYYCWKYGLASSGAIWGDMRLSGFILDMVEVYAEETGQTVQACFRGNINPVTPLKLARTECERFLFFWRRGLRVGIGCMSSIGGSAPCSVAGALVLHLAEKLAVTIIERIYYGGAEIALRTAVAPLDMRTGSFRYGRPEAWLVNVGGAQLARRLSLAFRGHCGMTDAKVPSYEAGVQKSLSAMMTALACGQGSVVAGLLSTDEVFSPVQMVLDNDLVGSLNRCMRGIDATEDAIGFDTIVDVGPGGCFLNTEHTYRHFKKELWMPGTWSKDTFEAFHEGGRRTDVDYALELVRAEWEEPCGTSGAWSGALEERLGEIIDRARALVFGD